MDIVSNQLNDVKLVPNVYLFDSEDKNLLKFKTTLNDGEKFEKMLENQFSDEALNELKTRSKINFSYNKNNNSEYNTYQSYTKNQFDCNDFYRKNALAIENTPVQFNNIAKQGKNNFLCDSKSNRDNDDEFNKFFYSPPKREVKPGPDQYCSTVSIRNLNDTLNTTLQEPGYEFLDSILNKVDIVSNQLNDVKLVPNIYLFDSDEKNLLKFKTTLNDNEKFEKMLENQFSDETLNEFKTRSKINFTFLDQKADYNNKNSWNYDKKNVQSNDYDAYNKKKALAITNSEFARDGIHKQNIKVEGSPTTQHQFCSTVSIRNPNDSVATMKKNKEFDFLNHVLDNVDKATLFDENKHEIKTIPNVYLFDSEEKNMLTLKSTLKNGSGLEKHLNRQFPQETLQVLKNANHINFKVVDNSNEKIDANYSCILPSKKKEELKSDNFKNTLSIKHEPLSNKTLDCNKNSTYKQVFEFNPNQLNKKETNHHQTNKRIQFKDSKTNDNSKYTNETFKLAQDCSTVSIRDPNHSVSTTQKKNNNFLNNILSEVDKVNYLDKDSEVKIIPSVYLLDSEEKDLLRLKSTLNRKSLEIELNHQFPRETLQALKNSNHINFNLINDTSNIQIESQKHVIKPIWNYFNLKNSDELKESVKPLATSWQNVGSKPLAITSLANNNDQKEEIKAISPIENMKGLQHVTNDLKFKKEEIKLVKDFVSQLKKENLEMIERTEKQNLTKKPMDLIEKSLSYDKKRPSSQFSTTDNDLKRSLTEEKNKIKTNAQLGYECSSNVVKNTLMNNLQIFENKCDNKILNDPIKYKDELSTLQSKFYRQKVTEISQQTKINNQNAKDNHHLPSIEQVDGPKTIQEFFIEEKIKHEKTSDNVKTSMEKAKQSFLMKIYSKEFVRNKKSPLVNHHETVKYKRPSCTTYKTVNLKDKSTLFKNIHPLPKKSNEYIKLVDEYTELHKLGLFKKKKLMPTLENLAKTNEEKLEIYLKKLNDLRNEDDMAIQTSKSCENALKNKTSNGLESVLKENLRSNFSDDSIKEKKHQIDTRAVKKINEYKVNLVPVDKKQEITIGNNQTKEISAYCKASNQIVAKQRAETNIIKMTENKKICPILNSTKLSQSVKEVELNKLVNTYLTEKKVNTDNEELNIPKTKDLQTEKDSLFKGVLKNLNLFKKFSLDEKNINVKQHELSKNTIFVDSYVNSLFSKEFKPTNKKRTLWMLILDEIVETIYGIEVFLRFERPKSCPFEQSLNIRGSRSLLIRRSSTSSQLNYKEVSFLSESIIENLNESVIINDNSNYDNPSETIVSPIRNSSNSCANQEELSICLTDLDYLANSDVEISEMKKLKDKPLTETFREKLNEERLTTFIGTVQKAGIKTVDDYFQKTKEEISPEKMIELKYKLMEDIKSKIKSYFHSNASFVHPVSQSNMERSIKVGVKIVKTDKESFKSIFFLTHSNSKDNKSVLSKRNSDSSVILSNKLRPRIGEPIDENLISLA